MKAQITFRKLDGSEGVALVNGDASDTVQAKRELASYLSLPAGESAGPSQDVDDRLQLAGIDPRSVKAMHISE